MPRSPMSAPAIPQQVVDSLNKVTSPHTSLADLRLTTLRLVSAFAEGGAVRQWIIDTLVLRLGADDPQVRQIADRLRKR